MNSQDLIKDKAFLQLLMETGFLAVDTNHFEKAEVIFEGVAAAAPESARPEIGLAYAALSSGNAEKAVALLEKSISKNPKEKDLCNSFLGLALRLTGQNEKSKKILAAIVENGNNAAAINMAKGILQENEKA